LSTGLSSLHNSPEVLNALDVLFPNLWNGSCRPLPGCHVIETSHHGIFFLFTQTKSNIYIICHAEGPQVWWQSLSKCLDEHGKILSIDCLGVHGWIILGWISRRWDVGIWNGLAGPG